MILKFSIFRARFFFGLDFLSCPIFLVASIFEGFKSQNIDKRTRLENSYPSYYCFSPTLLWCPTHGRSYVYCSGPVFLSVSTFVASDFFLSPPFSSLVLKASSLETLTARRGLKNPIQRTTFHLQRSSGARVMVGFVFAKFLFFTSYFRKV